LIEQFIKENKKLRLKFQSKNLELRQLSETFTNNFKDIEKEKN